MGSLLILHLRGAVLLLLCSMSVNWALTGALNVSCALASRDVTLGDKALSQHFDWPLQGQSCGLRRSFQPQHIVLS